MPNPNVWIAALASLAEEDRAHLTSDTSNPTAVLSEVLSLVEEKQTRSLEKRGKFKKPSGEVVILRDLFEKTAKWLHKFREIGDVVAQYDPVHTPFRHLAGCCYEKALQTVITISHYSSFTVDPVSTNSVTYQIVTSTRGTSSSMADSNELVSSWSKCFVMFLKQNGTNRRRGQTPSS